MIRLKISEFAPTEPPGAGVEQTRSIARLKISEFAPTEPNSESESAD